MLFCLGLFRSIFWCQKWAGGAIRWPTHGAGPTRNMNVVQKDEWKNAKTMKYKLSRHTDIGTHIYFLDIWLQLSRISRKCGLGGQAQRGIMTFCLLYPARRAPTQDQHHILTKAPPSSRNLGHSPPRQTPTGERIPKQPNESRGENLPEDESKTPRCKALAGQRTSPLLALPAAGSINNLTPNQPIQTS